jgi:hypothetical protein
LITAISVVQRWTRGRLSHLHTHAHTHIPFRFQMLRDNPRWFRGHRGTLSHTHTHTRTHSVSIPKCTLITVSVVRIDRVCHAHAHAHTHTRTHSISIQIFTLITAVSVVPEVDGRLSHAHTHTHARAHAHAHGPASPTCSTQPVAARPIRGRGRGEPKDLPNFGPQP